MWKNQFGENKIIRADKMRALDGIWNDLWSKDETEHLYPNWREPIRGNKLKPFYLWTTIIITMISLTLACWLSSIASFSERNRRRERERVVETEQRRKTCACRNKNEEAFLSAQKSTTTEPKPEAEILLMVRSVQWTEPSRPLPYFLLLFIFIIVTFPLKRCSLVSYRSSSIIFFFFTLKQH